MIPSDQDTIDELQKLAERNIANGGWGDEVNIPGLPGETSVPITPQEREAKGAVSSFLAKVGGRRPPRK